METRAGKGKSKKQGVWADRLCADGWDIRSTGAGHKAQGAWGGGVHLRRGFSPFPFRFFLGGFAM